MKIYVDSDFKCHATDTGGLREIETDFFNGKCPEFIEGYRFIPGGETWTRDDGDVFAGEAIFPHTNYYDLLQRQNSYLETELTDADAALAELGVTVDG